VSSRQKAMICSCFCPLADAEPTCAAVKTPQQLREEPTQADANRGRIALQSVRELVGDLQSENHNLRVDRFQGVRSIGLYHEYEANDVVAEGNNGGDLVKDLLKAIDGRVPVRMVHASRGKFVRAEPISSLYEQGRVHHVGSFPELEDQMASFTPDLDRATQGSPDRVDALVWGLSEVMLTVTHKTWSVKYA